MTEDLPVTPHSPGAWDSRSKELLGAAARTPLPPVGTPAARQAPHENAVGRASAPPRRGAADPVKALMHRHRELCARAVDPLEIAAGLEAHGVTDRTAARFRHRDVFSLAEEMYARADRDDEPEPAAPTAATPPESNRWALTAVAPGAVAAVTVVLLGVTGGSRHLFAWAAGLLALTAAVHLALRHGPLATGHRWSPATRAGVCWLLGYAVAGDGLLGAALAGGPDGAWPLDTAALLGLALALAPAAWCARLFAVRAALRLHHSRGLKEFTASVRPLLLGVFVLFAGALTALLAACGALPRQDGALAGAVALGTLLLLARLLTVYGFTRAPALVLGTAVTGETGAVASVFIGRLPGCEFLGTPVGAAVDAFGPGIVPATVCSAAALVLLFHAARTLTLAAPHAPGDPP